MDIIDIINNLNKKNMHREIINMIEAMPENEKTPELISLLARAYNNVKNGDRENYQKALSLLKSVEKDLKDDANWNFRKGYALFYLDREGYAKKYFKIAMEKNPLDPDARNYVDLCNKILVSPCMEDSYRHRIKVCVEKFELEEENLRNLLLRRENNETIKKKMLDIFNPVINGCEIDIVYTDGRFGINIYTFMDRMSLLKLMYFKKRISKNLLKNWDINIGIQRKKGELNFKLTQYDVTVNQKEIYYKIKNENTSGFDIIIFCEKVRSLTNNYSGFDFAGFFNSVLVDSLGQNVCALYINHITFSDVKDEHFLTLDRMYDELRQRKIELDFSSEKISKNTQMYEMPPVKDSKLREDIMFGICYDKSIIDNYINCNNKMMNNLQSFGIVPGFIAYPIKKESVFDYIEKYSDMNKTIKQIIHQIIGEDAVTFTGEAVGLNMKYIDFVAWDLGLVLYAIRKIFKYIDVEYIIFKTFRKDVDHIMIRNNLIKNERKQC